MTTSITPERWRTVRESLAQTGDRFASLVSATRVPGATAIGSWSVTETAAHVAVIASVYATMLHAGTQGKPVARAHPIPDVENRIRGAALDEVAAFNRFSLAHMTERSPAALGDQIRASVGELLAISDRLDPGRRLTWLGGAQVPVAGWYAHLLNELNLHGGDIAHAAGTRWTVPQRDAASSFEMFLVAMLRGDTGHLLSHEPVPDTDIAVRFRSRYTEPVVFAVVDRRVVIDPPHRTVGATLYFRPAALMRILFNRLGRTRAALTGQIAVLGRKPWQLGTLLRAVRFP